MAQPADVVAGLERLVLSIISSCNSTSSDRPLEWKGGVELEKMAQLLLVATVAHENVLLTRYSTQRDVYYTNTQLFQSSSRVPAVVGDLCSLLSSSHPQMLPALCREQLGIGASGKCILAGSIRFHTEAYSETDVSRFGSSGFVIATEIGLFARNFMFPCDNPFVLIVEKESTARFLLDVEHILDVCPSCVLLCAKGYPCTASRNFIRRLHLERPDIPLYGIFDCDLHGVRILLTYMFGQIPTVKSVSSEKKRWSFVPVQWIGLRPSHLIQTQLHARENDIAALSRDELCAACRDADSLDKVHSVVASAYGSVAATMLRDVCSELRTMKEGAAKSELQCLQQGHNSPLLLLLLNVVTSTAPCPPSPVPSS